MEAPFFKLHYTFPQGWSAENDDVRMTKNRQNHEDAIKRSQAAHSHTIMPGNTKPTFYWSYDLLLATREPMPDGTPSSPFIQVRAAERPPLILNEAGDQARLMGQLPRTKLLEGPKEQKFSGHKFARSVLAFHNPETTDEQFEILFESVSGNYLLLFEFHAKTLPEANELAQTMESVKLK